MKSKDGFKFVSLNDVMHLPDLILRWPFHLTFEKVAREWFAKFKENWTPGHAAPKYPLTLFCRRIFMKLFGVSYTLSCEQRLRFSTTALPMFQGLAGTEPPAPAVQEASMKNAIVCTLLSSLALFLSCPYPADAAPTYRYTDLGTLPAPYNTGSHAYGINNLGQVTGRSTDVPPHAFLYSNGAMQDLGTLPSPMDYQSDARAINDSGQIVGQSHDSSWYGEAFLYSGGAMHGLGYLTDGYFSFAYGINDAGQIAGACFLVASGAPHAFLYSGSIMQDIGTLPFPYTSGSYAYGINSSGQAVGYSYSSGGTIRTRAFLYSDGAMQDLGVLAGGDNSTAAAINRYGHVAGSSTIASGYTHAFLYSDGVMLDLGVTEGAVESFAMGINASGQVVGYTLSLTNGNRAFLYSGGTMYDLNNLVKNLPTNEVLVDAPGINGQGQIIANSGNGRAYLLTPMQAAPAVTMLLLQ
ncbi:MAG: hypothetical protein ACP59X_13155 [Solidesulfovibrio sp. DCME]|uniref:hypothetical protein n=1 Tax=Solidesulfovibrio sp. DCME TaxID=3447380 RepID=UPI003D114A1E